MPKVPNLDQTRLWLSAWKFGPVWFRAAHRAIYWWIHSAVWWSQHLYCRVTQLKSDGTVYGTDCSCQDHIKTSVIWQVRCYDFSYFVLFTYVFLLFLEVSHGAVALTHFSLTHIAATLLTHSTAIALTPSIAILIALPHWYSIYSGQFCRLFSS